MLEDIKDLLTDKNNELTFVLADQHLKDSRMVLTDIVNDTLIQQHDIKLQEGHLPDIEQTTVALESLVGSLEERSELFPFFKTTLESLCENHALGRPLLPSIEAFKANPTLGTMVSLEGVVSFIGEVFSGVIDLIRIILKSILSMFTKMWGWVKNFFGPSIINSKKIIAASPNVNVKGHLIDIPEYAAKLLWDNQKKAVSTNIVSDIEELHYLFNTAFLTEINYRLHRDVDSFTNKLNAVKQFAYPLDNNENPIKYGNAREDENSLFAKCQAADNREREDYYKNTVEVYKKHNSIKGYIGGLKIVLVNDVALFKEEIDGFDDSIKYAIPAFDKADLNKLIRILEAIEKDFKSSTIIEELTGFYNDICDKFEEEINKLKGKHGKGGAMSVEAKRRLALIKRLFGQELQAIRSSVKEFHNHAVNVLGHILKMSQTINHCIITPNVKLLEEINSQQK